jgi:hypothetical protein
MKTMGLAKTLSVVLALGAATLPSFIAMSTAAFARGDGGGGAGAGGGGAAGGGSSLYE